MRLMEYERASWLCCLLTTLQGTEADLPHTAGQKNDIICLQETHGKDEFLQSIPALHAQFRMFGTFMLNSVNAGGSSCFTMRLSLTKSHVKGVTTLSP